MQDDRNTARALCYSAERTCEMRDVAIAAGPEDVLVETLWSGVSRGTERLVFEGRAPESEWTTMRAPFQQGDFPFPVIYGYAAVGRVVSGPDGYSGRHVFALHPHQDRFAVPASAATPLPPGLSPRRAILAANTETALNAIWDAGAAPGDRIAVIGAGALGLLTSAILSRIPAVNVTLTDIDSTRAVAADNIGVTFVSPDELSDDHDIAMHSSASAGGLAKAIGCLGFEGRLVEMSWYGDASPPAPLGGAFHSRRLTLTSSQVGHVPPARRARWTRKRRLETALDLLAGDDRLDSLITDEIAFDEAPAQMPAVLAPGAPGVATAIRYNP